MIRIIFMGTPDFAVPVLRMLINNYCVVCVVTKTDKPRGRGKKVSFSPVKETAIEYSIPVLQPESVKTDEFYELLRAYNADLLVTCAYGKILPQRLLELAPLGAVNVHAGMLPKYRGSSPLWHTVINGEKESGITVIMMDAGMDSGDILATDRISVGDDMTMGELHDTLSAIAPNTLEKVIKDIESGNIRRIKQNEAEADYCSMIDRETGHIDWSKSAKQIHDLIRGTNPYPCAYTNMESGERIKLWKSTVADSESVLLTPGDIIAVSKDGIDVATGKGVLRVLLLQGESSRCMSVGEYINGHKVSKFT